MTLIIQIIPNMTFAKLRGMLLAWHEVSEMVKKGETKPGGMFDVSMPDSPIYYPPAE